MWPCLRTRANGLKPRGAVDIRGPCRAHPVFAVQGESGGGVCAWAEVAVQAMVVEGARGDLRKECVSSWGVCFVIAALTPRSPYIDRDSVLGFHLRVDTDQPHPNAEKWRVKHITVRAPSSVCHDTREGCALTLLCHRLEPRRAHRM